MAAEIGGDIDPLPRVLDGNDRLEHLPQGDSHPYEEALCAGK
jgi:hypothetical protein